MLEDVHLCTLLLGRYSFMDHSPAHVSRALAAKHAEKAGRHVSPALTRVFESVTVVFCDV